MQLNEEQRQAVMTTEGFVRVIAGAGSGKTRALTHRFAFLVNEMGILPGNILCVTFTNKAAGEMRQRIHNLIGDSDTGYINTFHGFCVSVLQEDSYAVQYPQSFLVLDNGDIDAMLKIIYEERNLTLRDRKFSDARDMIEMQKLKYKPEYYRDLIGMSLEALHEKYEEAVLTDEIIFYGYLYQQKKCFGLDYNDLIKFTLYIFEQNEEIRLKWQKRLEYIMIDEFQDIDDLQYRLMKVLCGYHRNLFIVGDPDQTIYTWRGANVRYLMEFDKEFPSTQTILMVKNYRSTPQILSAVNSLIDKNRYRIRKDLEPVLEAGEAVTFHYAANTELEAKWIADRIRERKERGTEYRDMTILYRAHYVTRSVEDALLKAKIPYHIYSGTPFYGRVEVKDALCYLRMIVFRDDLSFRRIVNQPARTMGNKRMAFLEEFAQKHGCTLYQALKRTLDEDIFKRTKAAQFVRLIEEFSAGYEARQVSDLLSDILDKSGYEEMLRTEGSQEKLDNLAELKQAIYEYETTCGEETTAEHYLAHIAMFTNSDVAEGSDKVKLMTVHAAKGLEFPYVFLCGMNEGIFPSRKIRTLAGMEEERRIAFVAMTRAQKKLFLTGAGGRVYDGVPQYPSRFVVDDIDPELLDYTEKMDDLLIRGTKEYAAYTMKTMPENLQQSMLPAGTRVRHKYLGEGTILESDAKHGKYSIQFDGIETPRTITTQVKMEVL